MSLLDDVSIVVTPNGYKAGELYAVIPVPTEGAEEITNGDFATDTDWVKETGWTISGDTANYDGVVAIGSISQNVTFTVGKRYKYTFTISNSTQGGVRVFIGNTVGIIHSSDGTYTGSIVYSSGAFIILQARDSFIGSIDNVSVKEYTSADMDVTRATDATRVDENGLVNYAEILGDEEVTNGDFATDLSGWTTSGTNATNTITWETNGARIISTGTNIGLFQNTLIVGKTYRLTCDVAITVGKIGLDGATSGSTVNMVEGFNEIIFTAISTTFKIKRITGNDNCLLDNVSVKEVTRDNVPRIDYTGGGCPHILAEPQRTNLITYSSDFTSWNQIANITLTQNSTTSPSGESDGTKFLSTSTGAKVRTNFSAVSGTTYTFSVYCKNIDATLIKLLGYDGANEFNANLTSEVNTSTWTRISLTFTAANTAIGQIQIARDLPDTQSAYFWGAQLEEGSYATSYIPTSGSTVTRNQDIFTRDGIGSLINSTEGVLFLEVSALALTSTLEMLSLSDGTYNNVVLFRYYDTSSNDIQVQVKVAGSTQASMLFTLTDATDFNKIAFKYKENDFALWVNGTEVATDTSGNTFTSSTLNKFSFDRGDGSNPLFSKVKQLQVYDTALTDEQLLQLTGESGTDFYESYAEMASALTYTIQ
jgi:hypothetical protein